MYPCSRMCSSVLGGLVAVTGAADLLRPWDSLLYGFAGAAVVHLFETLLHKVGHRER